MHAVPLVVLMCKMVAEAAGVCLAAILVTRFPVFVLSEDVGVEIGGVHMVWWWILLML